MRTVIAGFVAASGLLSPESRAAETVFGTGPAQVSLVELYTSEGCSSCPAAEKSLADLRQDSGLWKTFVPVAFHVNYWDHLGWRDALASKAFTDREYAYADAWRSPSVYTPCFVRNGQEWQARAVRPDDRGKDTGTLTVIWQPDTKNCRVEFVPAAGAAKATKLDVSVALLGGGIVSNVRKGENAGRELRHEFAALRLETVALKPDATGAWSAMVSLPARPDIAAQRHAIAAWISAHGKLEPIQAAGGWIDP